MIKGEGKFMNLYANKIYESMCKQMHEMENLKLGLWVKLIYHLYIQKINKDTRVLIRYFENMTLVPC